MEFWFSEFHTPDVKHSIRVNRQLYSKQSDYQRIDIFETPEFGRVLTLDGNVMLTERDEFIYDEMIVHVPMAVHKEAKDILVIGAGDGGVVRELTRYDRVERIDLVEMDPQVVEAEYTLDRSKIMFYFTADGRVDFRELVKDLAGIFHTRIELRQIGVRDESKMIGGLGICGQPFCCSRFLKDFQPVSIKMAKEQGLSLNPTKISGACGRLMCCLSYEENAYEYLNSIMPMVGSTVRTPDGLGTVLEVNPISGYLRVRCGTEALTPRYYKVGVCEYISGGKRAPRRPDPDDDYSGVRNPAPVVAAADEKGNVGCGKCPKKEK